MFITTTTTKTHNTLIMNSLNNDTKSSKNINFISYIYGHIFDAVFLLYILFIDRHVKIDSDIENSAFLQLGRNNNYIQPLLLPPQMTSQHIGKSVAKSTYVSSNTHTLYSQLTNFPNSTKQKKKDLIIANHIGNDWGWFVDFEEDF